MDALTLYMLVRLANGEAHVALKEPLNGRTCEQAKLDPAATNVMDQQIKAKPKLIAIFCTDVSGRPPEVSVSPPAGADRFSPPAPDGADDSAHRALTR